jgi:glycosyltransferase involved in cell wall biosynthesis
MTQKPKISIVTPSFNMLPYLQLCHASIVDQGVSLEHIVADGGSTDGTANWLKENNGIISISEKDKGMYNALNKAISLSSGDIIGHLNCDEQYLPGVLEEVLDYFNNNPHIDFIAGDFLVIDKEGAFISYRKNFQPRWQYFFSNYLYTTTCTLFYRRKIFDKIRFDESYRSISDVIFLYQVIRNGFKGAHLRKYFSVFTYSGANLSLDPISKIEKARFNRTLPGWYKVVRPLFFLFFYVERIVHNVYREKSKLAYAIFLKGHMDKRVTLVKENPGFRLKFERRTND